MTDELVDLLIVCLIVLLLLLSAFIPGGTSL